MPLIFRSSKIINPDFKSSFSTLFPEPSQNLVKKNPALFSTYKDCNKFSMSNPPKAPASEAVLT